MDREKLQELNFTEVCPNTFEYAGYVKLELEEGDWVDPAFDVFIRGTYITCISTEQQLIKIFDACHLW